MKKTLIPLAVLTGVGIYYGRKIYLDFQKFKAEREQARQEAKRRAMKSMIDRVISDITGEDHTGHEHTVRVVEIQGPPTRENLLAELGKFLDQVPGLDADDESREKFADVVDGLFSEHVTPVPPVVFGVEDPHKVTEHDLVGQPGDPTKIEVCNDPGHQGEEVPTLGGRCPDKWQHVTEWERQHPSTGKVVPFPDQKTE